MNTQGGPVSGARWSAGVAVLAALVLATVLAFSVALSMNHVSGVHFAQPTPTSTTPSSYVSGQSMALAARP